MNATNRVDWEDVIGQYCVSWIESDVPIHLQTLGVNPSVVH